VVGVGVVGVVLGHPPAKADPDQQAGMGQTDPVIGPPGPEQLPVPGMTPTPANQSTPAHDPCPAPAHRGCGRGGGLGGRRCALSQVPRRA
jgi:hypothetical protein